jgi:hypothetical protein
VYVASFWRFVSIVYTLELQEPISDVRTLQTSALEQRDCGWSGSATSWLVREINSYRRTQHVTHDVINYFRIFKYSLHLFMFVTMISVDDCSVLKLLLATARQFNVLLHVEGSSDTNLPRVRPRQVIKVDAAETTTLYLTALPTVITHITIIPLGTYNTTSWYIFFRDDATSLVFSLLWWLLSAWVFDPDWLHLSLCQLTLLTGLLLWTASFYYCPFATLLLAAPFQSSLCYDRRSAGQSVLV